MGVVKMAKYTTELRTICESKAGFTESAGGNVVQKLLEKSAPLIFDFDFPIFDENYRKCLEIKILRHFYTREIGFETVGLWKLKMCTKLNEIMPLFNKLYESELLQFNPLYTVNTGTKHNSSNASILSQSENTGNTNIIGKTVKSSSSSNDKTVSNANGTSSDSLTQNVKERMSDTPQGSLENVENNTYLTEAKITDTASSNIGNTSANSSDNRDVSNKSESSENSNAKFDELKTLNNRINSTEDYIESVSGYNGTSATDLLVKFRNSFINIDVMIIDELEELFFQLW